MDKLNKNQIRDLLPHRDPMLLVDEYEKFELKKKNNKTIKIFFKIYIKK